MARQGTPFDEIMIVNPLNYKGEKRMRFYPINTTSVAGYVAEEPEEMSYFGDDMDGMGYIYEEPESMGYVAEGPYETMGYVADPPPGFTEGFDDEPVSMAEVAEYADEPGEMGYVYDYPEDQEMSDEMGYIAEDELEDDEEVDYGGEDDEMGYIAEDELEDGEDAEMGYFADDEMDYGDEADEMGYFSEDDMNDIEDGEFAAYVPETEPAFNQRCVPPNKVSGIGEYIKPRSINPTCKSLQPAETVRKTETNWFKPLW